MPMSRRAVAIAAAIVAIQATLMVVYAWPALNLGPRHLPIVVAGPSEAAKALAERVTAAGPRGRESFDVTIMPNGEAADRALRDREAYAAFVLLPGGVSLHVSSAASPTVAQLLTSAAQGMAAAQQPGAATIEVVDVVPSDPDDPRGAGFAAGFLPIVITSLIAGIALTLAVRGRRARALGTVVFAALAGVVEAAVLQHGLGAIPGGYLANAGVIALTALAMTSTIAGLGSLLGLPGVALAVLTFFAVGNPLSAVTAAPELLPAPWGLVGQLLPPGAGGTLLRSVAYFDGAGGGRPAIVLSCWAAVGLALIALGRRAVPAPLARQA